jgi:hypothetical protein
MGYNDDQLGPRLILDIETLSLSDADDYLEPVVAPANYRDPEKIRSYQEEKRADLLARCALDPDLCQIVAVGLWNGRTPEVWTRDGDEEVDLLERVWKAVRQSQIIIGFNILGFDLPVLIRRSQYLGIPTPPLNLDRYRTPHVDLMERLSFNGKLRYRGLEFYCKRFGIDVEDAVKGKDVAELVAAEDWAAVAFHCLADLTKTQALAERLGYVPQTAVAGNKPTDMESGLCCMAAHAQAVAPWTCQCQCHALSAEEDSRP